MTSTIFTIGSPVRVELILSHFCLDQALLQIMRQQHSRAVKAMFSVTDNKRLKNLMTGVISKMKDVLQDSKNVIDAAEFRPNSEVYIL